MTDVLRNYKWESLWKRILYQIIIYITGLNSGTSLLTYDLIALTGSGRHLPSMSFQIPILAQIIRHRLCPDHNVYVCLV